MGRKKVYTNLMDLKGVLIYEDSIIGLRLNDSEEYMDKVKPIWNRDRQIYEFESTYKMSVYNPDKPVKYLCISDLYGVGSTFEIINNQ